MREHVDGSAAQATSSQGTKPPNPAPALPAFSLPPLHSPPHLPSPLSHLHPVPAPLPAVRQRCRCRPAPASQWWWAGAHCACPACPARDAVIGTCQTAAAHFRKSTGAFAGPNAKTPSPLSPGCPAAQPPEPICCRGGAPPPDGARALSLLLVGAPCSVRGRAASQNPEGLRSPAATAHGTSCGQRSAACSSPAPRFAFFADNQFSRMWERGRFVLVLKFGYSKWDGGWAVQGQVEVRGHQMRGPYPMSLPLCNLQYSDSEMPPPSRLWPLGPTPPSPALMLPGGGVPFCRMTLRARMWRGGPRSAP